MTRLEVEASRSAITAEGAAVILAAMITADPRPLVQLLQRVTGQPVLRVHVTGSGDLALGRGMLGELDAPEGTTARWRTGYLLTETGMAAADVTLTWIPERLPPDAQRDLAAGQRPAGHILGPLGAERHHRAALAEEGGRVHSQAVLYLGWLPVAIAEEHVTAQFCEVMAANWERCLPGCG